MNDNYKPYEFAKMKLPSAFRVWVTNQWYDHREEVRNWGGEPIGSPEDYFQKYKWWLKTVYQKENKS